MRYLAIVAVAALVTTSAIAGISGDNLTITPRSVQPDDEVFSFHQQTEQDGTAIAWPKLVFSIKANGEVEFGEGVTLSEASKAFWEQVGKGAPCAN